MHVHEVQVDEQRAALGRRPCRKLREQGVAQSAAVIALRQKVVLEALGESVDLGDVRVGAEPPGLVAGGVQRLAPGGEAFGERVGRALVGREVHLAHAVRGRQHAGEQRRHRDARVRALGISVSVQASAARPAVDEGARVARVAPAPEVVGAQRVHHHHENIGSVLASALSLAGAGGECCRREQHAGRGRLHASGSKKPASRFLRTLSQGKQRPFIAT